MCTQTASQAPTEQELVIVANVLKIAIRHDRECNEAWRRIAWRIDLYDGPGASRTMEVDRIALEAEINSYETRLLDLCVLLSPAILRSPVASVLARFDVGRLGGQILELDAVAVDHFLGPMFEDAGISRSYLASAEVMELRRVRPTPLLEPAA